MNRDEARDQLEVLIARLVMKGETTVSEAYAEAREFRLVLDAYMAPDPRDERDALRMENERLLLQLRHEQSKPNPEQGYLVMKRTAQRDMAESALARLQDKLRQRDLESAQSKGNPRAPTTATLEEAAREVVKNPGDVELDNLEAALAVHGTGEAT